MLAQSTEEIEKRVNDLLSQLQQKSGLTVTTVSGESAIGGGSGPNVHPPTTLIALKHSRLKPDEIERKLRLSSPPIIARIAENQVLLDLRTVDETDEPEVLKALQSLSD